MKTKIAILFIVCTSAAFLLGAKTKLKWPYLPAEANKTVSIVRIELTCDRAGFEAIEPIAVNRVYQKNITVAFIDTIRFKPTRKHIAIMATAHIAPKVKQSSGDDTAIFLAVKKEARRRINAARWVRKLSTKLPANCPCVIEIRCKGKPVARYKTTF